MFSLRAAPSLRTATKSSTVGLSFAYQPISRTFHASAAKMVVPTYFEVEWTGPYVTADPKTGKTIKKDSEVKSMCCQPFMWVLA